MSDYQGPPHMAQQQYQVRYNIQQGQQPMHQMMSQPMQMHAPVQHQQIMMHNPSQQQQQQMQQHHAQMQMQQQQHMQRAPPQGMMQMQHHLMQQRPTPQMIQQSQMTPQNAPHPGAAGPPPHSQHQSQPSGHHPQFSAHPQQQQQPQPQGQLPPHSQAHHPQFVHARPSISVYGHPQMQPQQPPPGPGPATSSLGPPGGPQQHHVGMHPQQFQQQPQQPQAMMRPQIRYATYLRTPDGAMPIRQELPHTAPQMVPQSTASQPSALRQALGHVTVISQQPHQPPMAPDVKPQIVHVTQVAGPPPGMQPVVTANGHHVMTQPSTNVVSHAAPPHVVQQQQAIVQRPHTPQGLGSIKEEATESPPSRPPTQQNRTPVRKPAQPKSSAKGSGKANKSVASKVNGGPPSASSVPSVSTIGATPGGPAAQHLLGKRALEDLAKNVDQHETLDDDVSEAVLQLVDDFVDDLVQSSARLARHRNGGKVEARDVRFILTRKFHMALPTHSNAGDVGTGVPGTSSSGSGPPSKKPAVNAHQQRLALIEKTLKKP